MNSFLGSVYRDDWIYFGNDDLFSGFPDLFGNDLFSGFPECFSSYYFNAPICFSFVFRYFLKSLNNHSVEI